MPALLSNIVQVAGVKDAAEASMLVASGVKWLGFPLRLDVHTPDLTENEASEVIGLLPSGIAAVVITYTTAAAATVELCDKTGADWVQLHGPISVDELRHLRSMRPKLGIIKSLIVTSDSQPLLAAAEACSPWVDAFITDTYDPETGASGATGKIHDWRVSRQVVNVVSKPVILAGGLTADNVGEAIRMVRPAGVDAHTGLEGAGGRKDRDLVVRFLKAAKAAFAEAGEERKV